PEGRQNHREVVVSRAPGAAGAHPFQAPESTRGKKGQARDIGAAALNRTGKERWGSAATMPPGGGPGRPFTVGVWLTRAPRANPQTLPLFCKAPSARLTPRGEPLIHRATTQRHAASVAARV